MDSSIDMEAARDAVAGLFATKKHKTPAGRKPPKRTSYKILDPTVREQDQTFLGYKHAGIPRGDQKNWPSTDTNARMNGRERRRIGTFARCEKHASDCSKSRANEYSKSAKCVGINCPNRAAHVSLWKNSVCRHGIRRKDCPCRTEQPFRLLHLNRSNATMTRLYAELVLSPEAFHKMLMTRNGPSAHWRICSDHFHPAHVGNKNAFPLLGLGKSHAQIRSIVSKYGLESELPENFDTISLAKQRLQPCFSINRRTRKNNDDEDVNENFDEGVLPSEMNLVHEDECSDDACEIEDDSSPMELESEPFLPAISEDLNRNGLMNVNPGKLTRLKLVSSDEPESSEKIEKIEMFNVKKKYPVATAAVFRRRLPSYKCIVRCCPVTTDTLKPVLETPYFFMGLPSLPSVRQIWLDTLQRFDREFEMPSASEKHFICERHFSKFQLAIPKVVSPSLVPNTNLTPEEAAGHARRNFERSKTANKKPEKIPKAKKSKRMKSRCCDKIPVLSKSVSLLGTNMTRLEDSLQDLCDIAEVEKKGFAPAKRHDDRIKELLEYCNMVQMIVQEAKMSEPVDSDTSNSSDILQCDSESIMPFSTIKAPVRIKIVPNIMRTVSKKGD